MCFWVIIRSLENEMLPCNAFTLYISSLEYNTYLSPKTRKTLEDNGMCGFGGQFTFTGVFNGSDCISEKGIDFYPYVLIWYQWKHIWIEQFIVQNIGLHITSYN